MRRAAIGVLVLASILVGSMAAGTPVAGNDTVAAVTAGIEIGAGTHPAPRVVASVARSVLDHGLLQLLVAIVGLAGVLLCAAVVVSASACSVLRWQRRVRRGPPAFVSPRAATSLRRASFV